MDIDNKTYIEVKLIAKLERVRIKLTRFKRNHIGNKIHIDLKLIARLESTRIGLSRPKRFHTGITGSQSELISQDSYFYRC